METMKMTTITVSERTRRELLRVAAEIQAKRGAKVDYEDAIEFLLLRSRRNPELFKRAMIGSDVPVEEFRKALREGRAEDKRHEEELEQRHIS